MTTPPPERGSYSLTRRLTARVLALVALGWLLAAAGALYVLDRDTGETLADALHHEAQVLAALAGQGARLPSEIGDDRTLRIIPPASTPASTPDGTSNGTSAIPPDTSPEGAAVLPRPWPVAPAGAQNWRGDGWHVARAALPDGGWLELGERRAARREELAESIRGLILVMLPLAVAVLLVIRLTLGQALRPVAALSEALAVRDAADLAPLHATALPHELAPVADSLNRYLARLAALLDAERSFAANAAHELRTPIATARAQAQLSGAAEVIAPLDRLAALTERLVQLVRAESGVALARAPVDLTRLVPLVLSERAAAQGHPVRFDDGDLDHAQVMGDADGLAILIGNLVDNARRHGTGPVRVRLSPGPRLTVTNPVAPGARFRTDRFDRDANSAGSGLGLTIAAALAHQAGARLTMQVEDLTATATLDWGAAG